MSACCENPVRRPQKLTFGTLAQQILSLDAAVEWVALEQAGREPRWAWRNPKSGSLYTGTTSHGGRIVDPFLLMIADHPGELSDNNAIGGSHQVLFVVLAYSDSMQVVAYLRPDAHVVVAVSPGTDPYVLGKKVASLLARSAGSATLH